MAPGQLELEPEGGELMTQAVVQLARDAKSFALAYALDHQRARAEDLDIGACERAAGLAFTLLKPVNQERER